MKKHPQTASCRPQTAAVGRRRPPVGRRRPQDGVGTFPFGVGTFPLAVCGLQAAVCGLQTAVCGLQTAILRPTTRHSILHGSGEHFKNIYAFCMRVVNTTSKNYCKTHRQILDFDRCPMRNTMFLDAPELEINEFVGRRRQSCRPQTLKAKALNPRP
jgi:hypothetical protein